jgi:hypothetical protein
MQELKESRRLVKSNMDLRLGNEARVAALVVRTIYFILSDRLILELYIVILFQYFKILFPFYLILNGFKYIIEDKCYSFIIMMFL